MVKFALIPGWGFLFFCLACSGPLVDPGRVEALRPLVDAVSTEQLEQLVSLFGDNHYFEYAEQWEARCSNDVPPSPQKDVCHLSRAGAAFRLSAWFRIMGLSVSTHVTDDPQWPTTNIIAEVPGVTRPEEVVLVGAHYDAWFGGADDNSSGVAAMLEVAGVLSGQRLARTVRFIGFDYEELGFVGSTRYVEAGKAEKVVASIVFDCVGYTDYRPGSQKSPPGFPAPDVGDFLGVIGNDVSAQDARQVQAINQRLDLMKVELVLAPAEGLFPRTQDLLRSDHAPFWLRGKPALFFTDTANFRNPNYHKISDLPETLDFQFLTDVTRLSVATVGYWAEVLP